LFLPLDTTLTLYTAYTYLPALLLQGPAWWRGRPPGRCFFISVKSFPVYNRLIDNDRWFLATVRMREDGMKKQVLAVDDEIGALTLIEIMLQRGGFSVLKARDAKEALSILEETTPDMIILDIMMPGMDGIELCKRIRSRPETQHTPVLILSARGDSASIVRGIQAGADDYLPKPILHHDLVSKVQSMLEVSAP